MTQEFRIISPTADVREVPDAAVLRGNLESELVFGETFIVEEENGDWARGHCAHDGYKGWVEKKHLGVMEKPTHIVTAVRSHMYRDESMKSPIMLPLSFGSRVTVVATGLKFSQVADGGWIYSQHISPIDTIDSDYVATALKFLHTAYVWGGRSGFGIDCSGLVQICLARAGINIPRDTVDQIDAIGTAVAAPQKGDLVFFKGHVGIMIDSETLLHANAFQMKVGQEPLHAVTARTQGIISIRRIVESFSS